MKEKLNGEVIIYKQKGSQVSLEVQLQEDTVWLDLNRIAKLFQRDKSVISRHINNIYKNKELIRSSTVAKYATVEKEGNREVTRNIEFYNLDMIISIGYRVNSKRGIQFRIWASRVLKDHIIKGYSINEKRLKEQNANLIELQKTANLMRKLLQAKDISHDEAKGLLHVITDYSYALTILDQYDHQKLIIKGVTKRKEVKITYESAKESINRLGEFLKKKEKSIGLFGIEKDNSFKSSLGAIYQTFDGKSLYPSLEERAAHLIYFITKNHSFVDGNKRIAAFIFIWYLDKNSILYNKDGIKRIGDNALVALTLMIAESNPKDKEIIIKVIINLINKNN